MTLKAYGIFPIDFGWEFAPTVEETAKRLADFDLSLKLGDLPYGEARLDAFLASFKEAKELATAEGWEGDIRGDAHVFFIPVEGQIVYGFVWKQDNNGDTFVVSPEPLPWLDKITF